jgi:nucleoside 2-deoxyribosyltransferase
MSDPTHYDVFLSHSVRDERLADAVKQKLADAGLSVFALSGREFAEGREPDAEFADTVLKALTESSALVALLTPAHRDSPALGVEIGAAWAQQKPVYVLVEGNGSSTLPAHLKRFQVYPMSKLSRAIPAIVKTAQTTRKGSGKR